MATTALEWAAAGDVARAIREGTIRSEQWVEACLARTRAVEPAVQAWQFLDPEYALAQARSRDAERKLGRPLGPLHGVPVGLKDIIDTADMPTENGTALHAGRTPAADATVVALLRAAGAVVLGKTVTTECATYQPGKTRNPHDPKHTPGGSSSGSAAAVAAGMVPFALGSQTNGSVIRPAAFCGVVGFKPTHGLISRHGILALSRTLDHVGVFARSVEDVALLVEQLAGFDANDPDTRAHGRAPWLATASEAPPSPPRLAFVRTPAWELAEGETRDAFTALAAGLGEHCTEYVLPDSTRAAWDAHRTLMEAEMAFNLEPEWERGKERLSESLRGQLARGREVRAIDYQKALGRAGTLGRGLAEIFERFDAILTPATAGTAPLAETTGNPAFCTLWTLCGMPCITLPLLKGANGLPLGVQLVGARDDDARLLRTARWLAARGATLN